MRYDLDIENKNIEPTEYYKEKSAELKRNIAETEKQLKAYESKGGQIDPRDAKVLQDYKNKLAALDKDKLGIKERLSNAGANILPGLEAAWESTKAFSVDWLSNVAGDDATDFLLGETDGGPVVFVDPENGEEISYKENPERFKQLNTAQMKGESVEAIYQKNKKPVGQVADEYLINQFKKIKSLNESIKEVGSITGGLSKGDFEETVGGVINAVSNLLTTAIPAALTRGASLFPQIAAPMYSEYNSEKAKNKYPESDDPLRDLVENKETNTTVPLVLGGISMGLEYIGLKGISKQILKNTGKFSPLASLILTNSKEGLTEVGQYGVETVNSSLAKGKDTQEAFIDGLKAMASPEALENFAQGFVGSGIISAPSTITKAINLEKNSLNVINTNINKLGSLQLQKKTTKSKALKQAIDLEIAETEKALKKHFTENYKISKSFSKGQQKEIISIINKKEKNTNLINDLKSSFEAGEINKNQYGGAKSALIKKNNILSAEIVKIKEAVDLEKLDTEINKSLDRTKNILKQLDVSAELNVVEATDKATANEQIVDILKKAGKTQEQINTRLKDYESGFGFFVTDSNDSNKEYLVLNKDKMREVGITTTAQHELLHKILKNRLANDPVVSKQMYESLQSEVAKLDKDVAKVFNGVMDKYMSDVENPNINYNLNNYYEEYFVQFSEFAANNLDKINNNAFTRIKDFIRRIFNKIGFTNIDFDEQGAINFIKDYNREFKKGKLSKATIKLANQNIKATKNKEVADVFSKSIDIDANTKSDIFTKANKVYEEYKSDPSSAGLMVGLEFEPIVKKMLNKYRDLFGMDEYTLDLIANDVMIETRPGYNGIPALVRTWDPAKGASLTSHIYGNLPNRILGIIQNKYPDLGKTVELVQEKADKLTTDEGFGGSGVTNDGFVDISSPEAYTRVSRKKAEVTMGMPPEYVKRSEEIGERILMSTKLEDLDARVVGTIKDSEGRTLRVAMLESDKARVYLPDGTTEIIKARTPKVVEQKYGAADRSFRKIASTKAQMIEEAKAYLIPEMEKTAGGLKDNYEPTLQYTKFIDKTFSLYKDYLSQSAINKRFADFKEPVIDPKTGKQAREKTAQGNKIFTKRSLALAEWRKYFIGDGTKRIDGRRRSLLEALATEQGFDKVMEVLGKEDMRKQIESRQEELSNDLIDNYVAVIAKSLDRNNPTVAFSKFTKELAALINKTQTEVENELVLWHSQGKTFSDLPEDSEYIEAIYQLVNKEFKGKIIDEISNKNNFTKTTIDHLKLLNSGDPDIWGDMKPINKQNKEELKETEKATNAIISFLPSQFKDLSIKGAKDPKISNRLLSTLFGGDSNKSEVIDDLKFNTDVFQTKHGDKVAERFSELNSDAYKSYLNKIDKFFEIAKELKTNKKGSIGSIDYYYRKIAEKIDKERKRKGSTNESIVKVINSDSKLLNNFIKETEIRELFFDIILDAIEIAKADIESNPSGNVEAFIKYGVGTFFLNQDRRGFRDLSSKMLFDITPYKDSRLDQHLKAKAVAAGEFIHHIAKGTLTSELRKDLITSYESSLGSKKAQDRADIALGAAYAADRYVKIGAEVVRLNKKGKIINKKDIGIDYLKNTYNVKTKETMYGQLMKQKFDDIVREIKPSIVVDQKVKKHNDKIFNTEFNSPAEVAQVANLNNSTIKQAKESNLGEVVANMIERKTGISAKAPLSASRAANIGRTKGKFNFYLPPNAEDFAGLLYKLYGKGKQGDKDMAFMKEHLLDPYNAGEQAISTYKQNLAEDYKSIEKQLGEIEGTVSKETKATLDELGFNADQAVRVALWNQAGFEIPGIQNIEAAKLRIAVVKDKRLKAYADGIRTIVKGNLFEPSEQWFSSNIRYDLFTHATEGVRPKFLEQWDTNVKEIFNKENLIKLEAAYGKNYVNNLNDMIARMKTGKSRGSNLGKEANAALDYLNGSIGVIMWMNTRSAMLQTISAVNYINWSDNNPVRIAQTLAKPKEFASTFMEIFNSDFLKQRRSGLEINVEEAEIARAVEKSKGKASKIFNALIKAGFAPTQIADSFAIAIGGTPLLMNRTKTYQRKGFEYAEAREKAFNDLREISEENQQSSRQDKVSNIQVGVMGRLVFAFNNTPFQMTRLQKKAALDLVNRRGDWKTNISKLAYYSTIQSVIFYALQQGAALTLFGKDDEDLTEEEKENIAKYKEKKTIGLANSVVDGFLSGSGLPGKILVTGKNTLAKYLEEEEKGYKADYGDVLNEAFSISPPISSKTKKAYSAFNTFRYGSTKKGKAKYDQSNKLSPLHPMNVARAKMFSAVTNIPLDRVVTKIDNLNEAVTNTDIEPQIKLALALGWGKWSLGFYDGLYGEDAKDVKDKKSSSTRKQKNREKALDLSKKSFKYRDSVRLANYRKKNKK